MFYLLCYNKCEVIFMTKPFKWFNDLIERSALWYVVYIIVLRIICGNFFYSLSDQSFYTFAIIFMSVSAYFAWKAVLKKLSCKYYKVCINFFSITFLLIIPALCLYFLAYHPLLGTFFTIIFALAGCYTIIIIDHFQAKKQA